MSRFLELLTPSLPAGLSVPQPLDRAWAWMESQGRLPDGEPLLRSRRPAPGDEAGTLPGETALWLRS